MQENCSSPGPKFEKKLGLCHKNPAGDQKIVPEVLSCLPKVLSSYPLSPQRGERAWVGGRKKLLSTNIYSSAAAKKKFKVQGSKFSFRGGFIVNFSSSAGGLEAHAGLSGKAPSLVAQAFPPGSGKG
jgi:hypothetical protein